MISIPKHVSAILGKAAIRAMPELTEKFSATPSEKGKEYEYSSPSCISIFNKYKKAGSFNFKTC